MGYTWIRGTTNTLSLRVKSGDVTGSETIRCVFKQPNSSGKPPGDDAPDKLVLTPTFVAASGGDVARWDFTASDTDTAALALGDYICDARIVIAGQVVQTAPITVTIVQRVTEAS